MKWGLAEVIAFSAAMTLQNRKFEKEQRFIKTQKFYQNCCERITEELSGAVDLVAELVQKATLVYFPSEMSDGTKYLPLFCFDKIICRQGKVSKEQRYVLDTYFSHFQYGFTLAEFVRASISGGQLKDFRTLMEISETQAGQFWVNLFRAYYKAGTQEEFQSFVDSLTATMMQFSVLGDLDNTVAFEICEKVINAANIQIKQVLDLPITELDWMGLIPLAEHKARLKELFDYLIAHSGITEDIDEDSLKELLDIMLLHSICDMAMLTKKPNTIKVQMIEEAVRLVDIVPVVSPEEYMQGIATGKGVGGDFCKYFSCKERSGIFWTMIATMGGKVDDKNAETEFLSQHFSILTQVEELFVKQYQFLGVDHIAQSYCLNIANKVNEYIDSLEE